MFGTVFCVIANVPAQYTIYHNHCVAGAAISVWHMGQLLCECDALCIQHYNITPGFAVVII